MTTSGSTLNGNGTLNWRGVTASTQNITFGGTVSGTWILTINPVSATANANLTTGGQPLNSITSGNNTATVTLQDDLNLSAVKTNSISMSAGGPTWNLNGHKIIGNSSINRVLITSSAVGTSKVLTVSAGTFTNADFRDINFDNGGVNLNLSAITGNSGDCGGNGMSGGGTLTLTTGVQLYWRSAASSDWATAANWDTNPSATSRVPLPQDNVSFNASAGSVNLNSGITVTIDMPRVGENIDFTGMTFTTTKPIFTFNAQSTITVYGSLTLLSSTNMTWTVGATLNFEGRAANMPVGGWTLTSAGQNMIFAGIFQGPGGTYQLQDALSSVSSSITLTFGTLDANNFNITSTSFSSNNTNTRGVTMGTGTFTVTLTGTVWGPNGTGFTYSGGTIVVSNTTATAKTFGGNNIATYNIVTFTGQNVTVTGANTFATLNLNTAGLPIATKFTASVTQTVTSFNTNGSAGNLVFASSTTGVAATLAKAGGGTICTDFMNIQSITGTPASTWYVGANSTDSTNNTGLIFTACPAGGGAVLQDEGWFMIFN